MPTQAELTEQVRTLMAASFGMDETDLPDDVTQQTCRRWSSLQHMTLMVSVEETFRVRLAMNEMAEMKSLPRIVETLARHLNAAAAA
jgi:acyl carrier protein